MKKTQWSSLTLRSTWVSRYSHHQFWCSTACIYRSFYLRHGGISLDLLCCSMLWALGWEAQKRMKVMIIESRSPAIGKEDWGKPKGFKYCRAVWGKGLDWLCVIWSYGARSNRWKPQRSRFWFKVRENRHFPSLPVVVLSSSLTTSQSRVSFKVQSKFQLLREVSFPSKTDLW